MGSGSRPTDDPGMTAGIIISEVTVDRIVSLANVPPRTFAGASHEADVVPFDAVHRAARRFPGEEPVGVGRHPFVAVRSQARASHVQRLHGRARIRRRMRVRRGLRQRASLERLRPDAVAQSRRQLAGAAHHRHGDLRARQLARALQPADAGRRRVRDDRLHLGRAADRRLPGRLADGHLLRLRAEPVDAARALSRSARPRGQGMDRARHLRLQRPLQPAALRQHLAAPDPEAAPADLDPRRRLGRDLAVVRARWTTSTATCRITATRPGRRR